MENGQTAYNTLKNGYEHRFCMENSAKSGHEYTYSVFLRAREQLSLKFETSGEVHEPANMRSSEDDTDDEIMSFIQWNQMPLSADAERTFLEHEAWHKRHAQSRAVEEYTGYVKDTPNHELVHYLLKTRQYDAFPTLFAKGVDFIASGPQGYSTLEMFAQNGFANLLDQIATLEASRRDLGENNGLGLFEGSSAEENGNPSIQMPIL